MADNRLNRRSIFTVAAALFLPTRAEPIQDNIKKALSAKCIALIDEKNALLSRIFQLEKDLAHHKFLVEVLANKIPEGYTHVSTSYCESLDKDSLHTCTIIRECSKG